MSTLLAIGVANALAAAVLALPAYLVSRSRRRPALAHALWLLVLLKLVTPPLFNVDLPWLPAEAKPEPALARVSEPPDALPQPPARAVVRLDDVVVAQQQAPGEILVPVTLQTTPPTQLAVTLRPPLAEPSEPVAEEPAAAVSSANEYKSDPFYLLLFVWLAGAVFVVGRAGVNVWRFHRLLAHAALAPDAVQAQANQIAHGMGLRWCPTVWLVPGPLPPMVWAVGRARILFPAGLLDRLDVEGRASLLAHELAHVRRLDHWVRWLELVVLGLYWWYPLAWIARWQMQAREEECCDAWAAGQSDPRVYATAILDAVDFLAEKPRRRVPAAASPLNGARSLRKRLTLIMSGDSPRRLGWLARLALLAVAIAILPLLPSLSRRSESAAPLVADETKQETKQEKKVADAEFRPGEPTDYNHVVNLLAGSDETFSVAFSRDGKRIAAGMGNARRPGLVQVWDADTRRPLKEWLLPRGVSSVSFGHDSDLLSWTGWGNGLRRESISGRGKGYHHSLQGNHRLSHSPDGKYVALAGEDRSLRLLRASDGDLIRFLNAEPTSFYCVTFSPTSRYVAAGGGAFSKDGPGGPNVVSVLEVASGKLVAKLTGHQSAVINVAFTPSEELIATASHDNTVRIWDGKSFALRLTLAGHENAVKGLAFSPDGKTLATGSWDRTIRLWDPFSGKLLAKLEGHPGLVREIAFSPDGKRLVSGGGMRSVKLWDVEARKEIATLRQDDAELPAPPPALTLAVSPDGKLLATGNEDGTVTLIDSLSGRIVRRLEGHEQAVTALAFSLDGKRLATGSEDNLVKVWGLPSGKVERELNGHTQWVYSLAFAADGKTLASGSYDRTVRVWDLDGNREPGVLRGHKAAVRGLAFSPNGRTLASGGSDGLVYLWDVRDRKSLGSLAGHKGAVRAVLFGRDSDDLFSSGEDGQLKRWLVGERKEAASVQASAGVVNRLALSPGGGVVATGNQSGYVVFFGAKSLAKRAVRHAHDDGVAGIGFAPDGRLFSLGVGRTLLAWEPVPGAPIRLFEGHTGPVRVATFSPDGKYLLSAGGWPQGDKTLRLWDVGKGEQVRMLTTGKLILQSAAFSPDGKLAVAGCNDGTIGTWEVSTGKEVRKLLGHKDAIPHLSFSPDGKWLLSSGHDKTARLWDAKTGDPVRTFTGHTDFVRCGAFLPDGKHVLTGGRDRMIRLWEVDTGKLVRTIDNNKDWSERLVVLPDGKRFLTAGGNAMRMYDLEGKLLRTYGAHAFASTSVALAKDGKTAMTSSYDGSARMWDVESGAELRRFVHHRDWVWSVEIAPDGKTFATAGGGGSRNGQYVANEDFAIRLWRMPQRGEWLTSGEQTDTRLKTTVVSPPVSGRR